MNSIPGLSQISRAREFHLYGRDGNRYLDMYLSDGRALLGHRPRGVAREISAALSRGLFAEYPSPYSERLERLLVSAAPRLGGTGREGRVFLNRERTLAAAAAFLGCDLSGLSVVDGARPEPSIVPGRASGPAAATGRVVIFRPFAVDSISFEDGDIVVPIVPFPGEWAPTIAFFPVGNGFRTAVPESDTVSPALLTALVRAIHNLLQVITWPGVRIDPARLEPLWVANGPYLFAACSEERYRAVFDRFLSRPYSPQPAVSPAPRFCR